MSGNVLDYIAKGVNSNYGGSFVEGLKSGQESAALRQKMEEALRVRNALQRAAQLAEGKNYPGAAGALMESGDAASGVRLLTDSDPSLAANRTQFFQPQLVFDGQGRPHYVQANNHSGNMQEAKMPDGWYPAPNIGMADTGTGLVPYNKRGPLNQIGQGAAPSAEGGGAVQNGVIPKNVSGEAQQKEQGQLAGKATVALPTVETNVQTALDTIQRLRNNKEGRNWARGMLAGRVGAVGGTQADWIKDYDQLQGATFLDAYESLRGAQAITDIEGKKGTEAKTSLNRVGSDKAFDSALNRLEALFIKGRNNARKKAAMGGTAPQQGGPGAPPPDLSSAGQASVEQETALLRQSKLFQTNPDAAIAKFAGRTGMSVDEARKMLGM